MSGAKHIAVLYSRGPHFTRALQALRKTHPGATLTAIVPAEYGNKEALDGVADAVVATSGGAMEVLRTIRNGRYDVFVVLFDSPKLRLLASLSGARECMCCETDGYLTPLVESPPGVVVSIGLARLRGHITYVRLWILVRILRVGQ